MEHYKKQLILSHFNFKKEKYDLRHIKTKFGLHQNQLESFLDEFFTKGFLSYNENNLITITDRGIVYLISNNSYFLDSEFHFDDKNNIEIDNTIIEPYDWNKIFVPKNFTNKV